MKVLLFWMMFGIWILAVLWSFDRWPAGEDAQGEHGNFLKGFAFAMITFVMLLYAGFFLIDTG